MKYVILVYFVIFLLNPIIARKHYRIYLLISVFMFSALAYFVIPTANMDLYRYLNLMDLSNHMGFSWTMRHNSSTNPLAIVFFYGMSLLKNNNLLPSVTVFIVYSCSFIILYRVSKRFDLTYGQMNILFLFLVLNLNYCYIIDVIRIYIAYAIMALFLYIDLIEKKYRPICFAVYIAMCYFHFAVVVILLLRIVLLLVKRDRGIIVLLTVVLIPIALFAGYSIAKYFTGENLLISVISDKIEGYITYETFGVWQFAVSLVRLATMLLISLVCIYMCHILLRRSDNTHELRNTNRSFVFSVFCIYNIITVFTFITNYQYVLRTPYFIQIIASVPLAFILSKSSEFKSEYLTLLKGFVVFESFAHFAYLLIYVYGNLIFSFA